jgi:diguanylate cyclase (GGDEF)-like protein
VTAALRHRQFLVGSALAAYAVIFVAIILFEVPGLGLPHFFYLPVAALALTGGVKRGIAAGLLASVLFAVALALNPAVPTVAAIFSLTTPIRLVTYTAMGALVGWFAAHDRQLVARLQILAERDFLTGLPNTRAFEGAIARRFELAAPFTLLLGDMDGLKRINDTRGHIEGNDVLRRLGGMLGSTLGPEDEVARVGGDEFAVITTGGEENAAAAASCLERVLAGQGLAITFGWARYPHDGENALSLYRAADERLYARKLVRSGGRVRRSLHPVSA